MVVRLWLRRAGIRLVAGALGVIGTQAHRFVASIHAPLIALSVLGDVIRADIIVNESKTASVPVYLA